MTSTSAKRLPIARRSDEAQAARSVRFLTSLSAREVEVLEHVCAGQSNKQIAAELGLGENGVKFHLKNIHVKLGAQRRTDAVRIAREYRSIADTQIGRDEHPVIVGTRRVVPSVYPFERQVREPMSSEADASATID